MQRDHWKLSGSAEEAHQTPKSSIWLAQLFWWKASAVCSDCFACDVKKMFSSSRDDGFVVLNLLRVDLFIGFSVQPFVMYSWSVCPVCFGPETCPSSCLFGELLMLERTRTCMDWVEQSKSRLGILVFWLTVVRHHPWWSLVINILLVAVWY